MSWLYRLKERINALNCYEVFIYGSLALMAIVGALALIAQLMGVK